jgi:carboxymethylenebutenolidase
MLMVIAIAFGATASSAQDVPASGDDAVQRLDASPRHGEWIRYAAGGGDSVSAWVVYPEREDAAPVVIVIHEIFGLTDWIRGVADQLAAAGFVAIAPDLLSGKAPDGAGTAGFDQQGAVRAIRELNRDEVIRRLNAAAEYATGLPSTTSAFAAIGFCWGGSTTFQYATRQPGLGAAVVYYGSAPDGGYEQIAAPVLGLYGGDDARVNATIPAAREAMQRLDKRYETEVYDGAGHGFLRAQGSREANLAAAREAWPRMVMFLKEALEAK